MSAFGGILNFGNTPRPVDQVTLTALGRGLETRGPDGGGETAIASVGMTYRAFRTTRESQFEVQPLISPCGHMLAWDGRLDNREELIRELRDEHLSETSTVTDLELATAAYLEWGENCFVRLIGDFCL